VERVRVFVLCTPTEKSRKTSKRVATDFWWKRAFFWHFTDEAMVLQKRQRSLRCTAGASRYENALSVRVRCVRCVRTYCVCVCVVCVCVCVFVVCACVRERERERERERGERERRERERERERERKSKTTKGQTCFLLAYFFVSTRNNICSTFYRRPVVLNHKCSIDSAHVVLRQSQQLHCYFRKWS